MPATLKMSRASDQQRLAAFANVFECWPWAPTLEDHIQKRIESPQYARATSYVGCLADEVVVSLASYPVTLKLTGTTVAGIMIGAVHTVPAQRGQGLAPRLLEWVEQQELAAGAAVSVLFSDVKCEYYERFGYEVCPSWQLQLPTTGIQGHWKLAEVEAAAHLAQLKDWYSQSTAPDPLALERDREYWDYVLRKHPEDRTFLIDDGGPEAAGYLRVASDNTCWKLKDWGLARNSQGRREEMLRSLAERAAKEGCARLDGWYGRADSEMLKTRLAPRDMEITMIKSLDTARPITPGLLEAAEWIREIDHV